MEGINFCKWVLRSNHSSVFVGRVRKPFPDNWATCQLLTQEIKHTGRNPTGNLSWRPAILPEKQMLLFLWSVANRELNCIVRAPTLGRETKPDISCEWNTKFSVIPEIPTNRGRFPFVWKNRSFRWEIKWNGPFHWKFFGKKGIPSEVFLFSRKFSPVFPNKWKAPRVHSKRIPKFSKTFPGIFTVPFNFEPEISEFLVEWKAPLVTSILILPS